MARSTEGVAGWCLYRGHVHTSQPSPSIVERVASLAGSKPVAWRSGTGGGYTPAQRWVAELEDGSSVFAKVATTEDTAAWLRDELRVYARLRADFIPRMLGWEDDAQAPVLLLEDLSQGEWPPPWSSERVNRVTRMLRQIRKIDPPEGLPTLEECRDRLECWKEVRAEPEGFLSLGLCSAEWLAAALPRLIEAEESAVLTGHQLVHLDVRSDNICFLGDRTLLVDWNLACMGNADVDLAAWAPSLHLEGGPPPEEVASGQPELAALVTGFFAYRAPLPYIPTAPRVRMIQLDQLRTALPWAARALGLPPPDGQGLIP